MGLFLLYYVVKSLSNYMERPIVESKKFSALEHQKILDFIEFRKIKPEDYGLILRLAAFDKNTLIESLHNLFNSYHEKSDEELELNINLAQTPEKKELYQVALEFYKVYGWAVSFNLVRVLEGV